MQDERHYFVPEPFTRQHLLTALQQGDPDITSDILLGYVLSGDDDFEHVQSICLQLLDSNVPIVRSTAAACLGHMFRIYGQVSDQAVEKLRALAAMPVLDPLVDDTASSAYIALTDMESLLGPQSNEHVGPEGDDLSLGNPS